MDWLIDLVCLPLSDWRVAILLLLGLLYLYLTWTFGYFERQGIPFKKPYPVLGTFSLRKSLRQDTIDCMSTYGKLYGGFLGRAPIMYVADADMLREVLVKEFSSFPNHYPKQFLANKYLARMLTVIRDDDWRHVRRILTPTFTAGKLKRLSPAINQCGEEFLEVLVKQCEANNIIDLKISCGNFTMDVIARTAFGLETNTQTDPDNEFVKHGRAIMQPTKIAIFFAIVAPWLIKHLQKLGFHIFDENAMNFFTNVVDDILEARKQDQTEGSDFIGMMASAHKMKTDKEEATYISPGLAVDNSTTQDDPENTKSLDKIDIVASGFIFFLAGFDTVATGLSVTLHHLAANPDCQQKLFEEVEEVMQDKTEVTYDLLTQMPYLEMCIMESLRLDPPVVITDRQVSNDITINDAHFEKGLRVFIPIYAIQRDPEYWQEPEKFDPERFAPEAKATRNPYVFLPFGLGPRDCIGKRLALMEMKIALIYLLRSFRLKPADGDKENLNYHTFSRLLSAWVKLEKRESTS